MEKIEKVARSAKQATLYPHFDPPSPGKRRGVFDEKRTLARLPAIFIIAGIWSSVKNLMEKTGIEAGKGCRKAENLTVLKEVGTLF